MNLIDKYMNESKNNTKFSIGDKFIDINSNKKDKFTVAKTDSSGVYDEDGWYRLNKNCKKTK